MLWTLGLSALMRAIGAGGYPAPVLMPTLIVVTNTAQLAAVDPVAVGDVDTGDVVIAVDTGAGNGDR